MARSDAAACTLPSGTVVLVGGGEDVEDAQGRQRQHPQNATAASDEATQSVSTIAYDQRSRSWSSAKWATLSHPREGLAAVALPDGRVFTLGGWGKAEDQSGSRSDGGADGSAGSGSGLALRSDLRITEVSASDGSGWIRTADMFDARTNPAVRRCPPRSDLSSRCPFLPLTAMIESESLTHTARVTVRVRACERRRGS